MPQQKEEIEQAYRSLLCLPILSPAHISASKRTLAWNPNPSWELGGVGEEGQIRESCDATGQGHKQPKARARASVGMQQGRERTRHSLGAVVAVGDGVTHPDRRRVVCSGRPRLVGIRQHGSLRTGPNAY
jgi:hypothetical protein